MLAQRLRRWPNIKTTLVQYLVFDWVNLLRGAKSRTKSRLRASFRRDIATIVHKSTHVSSDLEEPSYSPTNTRRWLNVGMTLVQQANNHGW